MSVVNIDALLDSCQWLAATPFPVISDVCDQVEAEPTPQALWAALSRARRASDAKLTRRIADRVAEDEAYAEALRDALITAYNGMRR